MARCGSCNTFKTYGEPEVEADLNVEEDGELTGTVELVLPCEDCGDGMRQTSWEVSSTALVDAVEAHRAEKAEAAAKAGKPHPYTHPVTWVGGPCAWCDRPEEDPAHAEEVEDHSLDVETDAEGTSRTEGKGRGLRTFYGHHTTACVTCSCGYKYDDVELADDVQASHMDEV